MYVPPQSSVIIFFNLKYLDQGKLCCYTDILWNFSSIGGGSLRWGGTRKVQNSCFLFLQMFLFQRVGESAEGKLTWNRKHEARLWHWHHLTATTFPSVEATKCWLKIKQLSTYFHKSHTQMWTGTASSHSFPVWLQ